MGRKAGGWIKLSRGIQNNWVWEDKPFSKGQAWIDLILMANHQEAKALFNGKPVKMSKGELLTSETKLSERWGWGRTKLRNFLKMLKNEEMIDQRANSPGTVITIRNYAVYQDRQAMSRTMDEQAKSEDFSKTSKNENEIEQETNKPETAVATRNYAVYEEGVLSPRTADEQRTNNGRTADEQCTNTNKNNKELKNDKERDARARRGAAPTLSEIEEYISAHHLTVNAKKFFHEYDVVGWTDSNGRLINWKQRLWRWHNSEKKFMKCQAQQKEPSYDLEKFDKLGYDIPEVEQQ